MDKFYSRGRGKNQAVFGAISFPSHASLETELRLVQRRSASMR
jgi:hypothetical protein